MKKMVIFQFYLSALVTLCGFFWFSHQTLLGVQVLLTLSLITLFAFRSILYPIASITMLVFLEHQEGILMSLPSYLYVVLGVIILLALFFKKKTYRSTYTAFGIGAIAVAVICSGSSIYHYSYWFTMVGIGGGLLLVYYTAYFSMLPGDAKKIASLIQWIGILIIFQVGVYYFKDNQFLQLIQSKNLDIGWAKSNQVGIALLATIPLTVYNYFSQKGLRLFHALVFCLQLSAMILTYSRGAVLASLIILVILFISFFVMQGRRYPVVLFFVIMVGFFSTVGYLVRDNLSTILDVTFRLGLNDNGRIELFQQGWQAFLLYPWTGEGFSLSDLGVHSIPYYHSTPIQFLATTGLVGFLAYVVHLSIKYYYVLKQRSLLSFYTLLAYLGVGLYGLIDVTFFTFPYTWLLILLMLMSEFHHHENKNTLQESGFFFEEDDG